MRVQPAAGLGVLEPDAVARFQRLAAGAGREEGRRTFAVVGGRRRRRRDEDGFDEPDSSGVRGGGDGGDAHLAGALSSVGCEERDKGRGREKGKKEGEGGKEAVSGERRRERG